MLSLMESGGVGFLFALLVTRAPAARAQTVPATPPAQLPVKTAAFRWDEDVWKAAFSFPEGIDGPMERKLSNGPVVTIAVRVLLFREGESVPLRAVAQQCEVTYDLWEDVYRVKLSKAGRTEDLSAVNVVGVKRLCTQSQNLPITTRSVLAPGTPYFLEVLVDVNPVNEAMRAQMRQFMQRPAGAGEVGPGDALFSAIVGLTVRDAAGSDRSLAFRTQSFTP